MEHCLFYSGELYNICENEAFVTQGLKAAKNAYKKKMTTSTSGAPFGSLTNDRVRSQKHENSLQGKQNKHSGSQHLGNYSGTTWGYQNSGPNSGLRRSELSVWLSLINKLLKKSLLPVCSVISFNRNFGVNLQLTTTYVFCNAYHDLASIKLLVLHHYFFPSHVVDNLFFYFYW